MTAASPPAQPESPPQLRHSWWDALLIALAIAHGGLLLTAPSVGVVAIGLWWNANTIAHNFIHLPFFRSRWGNDVFSTYLSLLLGLPQSIWRERHLAHHRGEVWRLRMSNRLLIESALVLVLWASLLTVAPRFFVMVYLPGYVLGLTLCSLQGYYEHACGTTSHYGWLYNWCFLNDGYHAEHHAQPTTHWRKLSRERDPRAHASRWPAVLRWMEILSLDSLERLVLRSPWAQTFVLKTHERAFRRLLSRVIPLRKATIVGGGIFPRSALILRQLAPSARLEIIDASAPNLQRARRFLGGEVTLREQFFDPAHDTTDCDLLVVPLAFDGDRAAIYRTPPAPAVLVHDWLWNVRGTGAIVSLLLLKRVNLVFGPALTATG